MTQSSQSGDDPIDQCYRRRIAEVVADGDRLRHVDRWCTVVRAVSFFSLIATGFVAWNGDCSAWWLVLPGAVLLAAAVRNEQVLEAMAVASQLKALREQQLARRHRRWGNVPVPAAPSQIFDQAVARDLDVFGSRSLFQWLCLARTPLGRDTLAEWLMTPAQPELVARRQQVVRALAAELDWRESLQLHASLLGDAATNGRQFAEWAIGPGWLAERPVLRWLTRLLPLVGVAMVLAAAAGTIAAPTTIGLLIGLLAVNLAVSVGFTGGVHDVFDRVSRRGDEVGHYHEMLAVATRLPDSVGHLPVGERDLREVADRGITGLASLHRITQVANARRSGFWGILVLIAHIAILWEFHVLAWLETWQRRHGREVPDWLNVIGQLEAFTSLATATYDHPDWCFPRLDSAAACLRAESLGHPLLPHEKRVANDVTVGPAGTLLLVTGSNMSGKSTLLRSLGVNVLLAQAGGPVCARSFELPPVEVQTSMRVADSLADGVSFFFAELLRLKQVVEHARNARQSGRTLLYLLDEILQGTNSRERQIAVTHVLRHLLAQGAIGAVSTHDLELASCRELQEACRTAHFRETLSGDLHHRNMTFDYLLRPGVSPTTNALVLLDLVGLGDAATTKDPQAP